MFFGIAYSGKQLRVSIFPSGSSEPPRIGNRQIGGLLWVSLIRPFAVFGFKLENACSLSLTAQGVSVLVATF
jgi:hypothetical protein